MIKKQKQVVIPMIKKQKQVVIPMIKKQKFRNDSLLF
jgi:hypothetical protein